MSGDRDESGRFRKGAPSANGKGRPRGSSHKLQTGEDISALIMKVMNRKVPQKAPGDGLPMVSLLERNVMSLATGNPKNRLASEAIIELAKSAAWNLERRDRLRKDAEKARQRG